MRASYLDSLRGLAVVWMVIFHTAYDLRMFRYIDWDFSQGFWYAFPRVIAFTFLFCVGIAMTYGHSPKVNWKAMRERTFRLGGAAVIISVVTYFLFPQQWIFFGTLHCILAGSLLGALVVNHRKLVRTLLVLILFLQYIAGFGISWVSSIVRKPSMDFIPIYPWFWAILAGIALAPYLSRIKLLNNMKAIPFLAFLGRHSLKIYLLHQPIIFGLIWLYSFASKK